MRFLGAFGLAVLLVLGMLLMGLKLSGFMEREDIRTLNLHEVDVLSESQRRELADALGGEEISPPGYPSFTDIRSPGGRGVDERPEAERTAR